MSSSLREQKRGGHIGLMGTTGLAAALALGARGGPSNIFLDKHMPVDVYLGR